MKRLIAATILLAGIAWSRNGSAATTLEIQNGSVTAEHILRDIVGSYGGNGFSVVGFPLGSGVISMFASAGMYAAGGPFSSALTREP